MLFIEILNQKILLIDNNMIVKIADFGTSALMKKDKEEENKEEGRQNEKYAYLEEERKKMEHHGTFVGTKEYMSIEVSIDFINIFIQAKNIFTK